MSLSFGSGDIPIALVDKTVLYMNGDEPIGNLGKTIELNGHKFQHMPNNKDRDVLYISAMSGSGKSYYTAEYAKQYHKKYSKNPIYLFSSIDEDKCLDNIKCIKRIDIKKPEFLNMELTAKDMENSLLIFDDCDVITNKAIKKAVFNILDSVLQTGRHFCISVIFTSHNACSGQQTKIILNESTSITIFPSTSGNKSLNYLCDQYLGLDKKQIASLKKIKGRWATFVRAYPRCILTETTCTILKE